MSSLWLDMHDGSQMPADELPARTSVDVAVAGGGLTGLTTAVALARTGRRVIVLEARTIGAVATGHTTAKLSLAEQAQFDPMEVLVALAQELRERDGMIVDGARR